MHDKKPFQTFIRLFQIWKMVKIGGFVGYWSQMNQMRKNRRLTCKKLWAIWCTGSWSKVDFSKRYLKMNDLRQNLLRSVNLSRWRNTVRLWSRHWKDFEYTYLELYFFKWTTLLWCHFSMDIQALNLPLLNDTNGEILNIQFDRLPFGIQGNLWIRIWIK